MNVQCRKSSGDSKTDEEDCKSNYVDIDSDSNSKAIIEHIRQVIHQLKDAVAAIAPETENLLNERFEVADAVNERDPFPHLSDNDEELDDYHFNYDTDEYFDTL